MLGIPGSPPAACEVLAHGEVRRLDLGVIGDRTFIGIASCGFDSEANRIANETTLVRGRLVYAYGLLRALAGWRPATFTVAVDGGEPRTVSGYTVAAANSRYYGGGMMLAPDATLQDGMLDVVIILETPKLRFLRTLPRCSPVRTCAWRTSSCCAGARSRSPPPARSRCTPTGTRSPSCR